MARTSKVTLASEPFSIVQVVVLREKSKRTYEVSVKDLIKAHV